MTKSEIEIAARALIAEYKKIWPGEWPALPEAIRLAKAVLNAIGPEAKLKV